MEAKRRSSPAASPLPAEADADSTKPVREPACVIASRNGAAQIGSVVARAVRQCPVFVISDGSSDDTACVARKSGAQVLELHESVGKLAAVGLALERFPLGRAVRDPGRRYLVSVNRGHHDQRYYIGSNVHPRDCAEQLDRDFPDPQ